jgi:hypothetical protein
MHDVSRGLEWVFALLDLWQKKDNKMAKLKLAENNNQKSAEPVSMCPAEGCKKPVARMHFCAEHFVWYKEGLLNKRGERPTDFDKKYQRFMHKKTA